MGDSLTVAVECRASESGPTLHGIIVQEGRAATGGRAEVFSPGSILWPAEGIIIRDRHYGSEVARAIPTREPNGEIRVSAPASPEVFALVQQQGRRYMSVEMHALAQTRTAGGVREISKALVSAAALTDSPEYKMATAEVRDKARRRIWL